MGIILTTLALTAIAIIADKLNKPQPKQRKGKTGKK